MINPMNIKDSIEYSDGGVLSKVLFQEGMNVTLFSMSKNTSISEHTSTKEGIVYVIEGKGNFVLEGKNVAMVPGVVIYMEKNAKHSLSADENTSFLLALTD